MKKTISDYIKSFPPDKIQELEQPTVKAGLHLESQKFGKTPKDGQLNLFEDFKNNNEIEIDTTSTGINLTVSQHKALHVIQTLLSKSNYKGNRQIEIEGYPIEIEGNNKNYIAPVLEFTAKDFLDLFGVTKKQSSRGRMEYNSNERMEALKALRDLNDIKHPIYYERPYWSKSKKKFDIVKTIQPLIRIIEGYKSLTEDQKDLLKTEDENSEIISKLHFAIIPSPIVVDQIDAYFVLKHEAYIEDIRRIIPKSSKFAYRFIDYLYYQYEQKRKKKAGFTIKIGYKELAIKLKMDTLIETRQWKRIRKILQECYDIAINLKYLVKVETKQGVTKEIEELVLNPDKFYNPKAVNDENI